MITASNFLTSGRLGNILFRYCSLIGLSKKYNLELKLPSWEYSKYFDYDYPQGEVSWAVKVKEPVFHYTPNWDFLNTSDNVDVEGYLQSEKYWQDTKEEVKKALTFKEDFKKQVLASFVANCSGVNPFEKSPIAISIRRGDYVNNTNYEQLPITHYILALQERFPDWRERSIIVFSDDIAYCKVHLDCLPNVYFSINNSDIEDLCLLSQCNSFIIANSTFSWFGAYIAELQRPVKVVRPNHHFSGNLLKTSQEHDIYPKRWEVFDYRDEFGHNKKINLKDTAFTIPVSFDHEDRKENLDLCIEILRKNFDTNIIVYEQGGSHFEYLKGVIYYSYPDMALFHRTKMLNDMAKSTSAKFVFNWDADVIISPMQILEAVNQLRNGADMVYPYSWAFARIPRNPWYTKLRDYNDIGIVGDTKFSGMNVGDAVSVGGAVGFNRQSFINGGMENEAFFSYNPEDVERKVRFEKLGFKVERTIGQNMYHLNHWVGVNSCFNNPHYNPEELAIIMNMTREELQEYVNTWEWCKLA